MSHLSGLTDRSESPEASDADKEGGDQGMDAAAQQTRLLEHVHCATEPLLRELQRAVAGEGFCNDHQRQAINTLACLLKALVCGKRSRAESPNLAPRNLTPHPPEIAKQYIACLSYLTKREDAERRAGCLMREKFGRDGPVAGVYQTERQAFFHGVKMYRRDHPFDPPPSPDGEPLEEDPLEEDPVEEDPIKGESDDQQN